jgi:acylphosphatase
MVAFDVRISGRVQGVGYRYYAHACAHRLGVAGYVRNLPNGTVEAVIVGTKAACDEMIRDLERGPSTGRVDGLYVQPLAPAPAHEDFRVTY